jgi:hypothetical protein
MKRAYRCHVSTLSCELDDPQSSSPFSRPRSPQRGFLLDPRTFPGFPYLGKVDRGGNGMRIMTVQLIETPRDSLMSIAEKELIAFERRERELRRQEKLERAQQLFPALARELQS